MQDTAQVNNSPEVNQPIQTPVENSIPVKIDEKPKKNSGLTLILSFTTIIATLIAGFFYFQNMQLRNELLKNLPSLTPTPVATPDETANWKIYKDEIAGFEIKYPQDWTFKINQKTTTDETDSENIYFGNISFLGPEGQIDLVFGNGFGGGPCNVNEGPSAKIEKITIGSYNVPLCNYSRNSKIYYGSPYGDAGGPNIDNTSYNFTFSYPEESKESNAFIQKILSTFKFNESEKINCTDPRPEVCTEECIVNPPYICGSDGKSYCTTCQACSNTDVEWYITQDTPCGEKISSITAQELEQGWYWGNSSQKKDGTPNNWIFCGDGTRSDKWQKPDMECNI